MNLYFLVEGQSTEKKVYPAWLSHLLLELNRVHNYGQQPSPERAELVREIKQAVLTRPPSNR
jgi:hypothetical protein